MLLVTIENIDRSFMAIHEGDMAVPSDKQKAAEATLASLIAEHGFFPEDRVVTEFPRDFTPDEKVYGFVMMPQDDEYETLDDENTYWVSVKPCEFGSIIPS